MYGEWQDKTKFVFVFFILKITLQKPLKGQLSLCMSQDLTLNNATLEHGFVWCWNLVTSGSKSETPGKFLNVVLEKDGEDQLDRSCEKWRSVT